MNPKFFRLLTGLLLSLVLSIPVFAQSNSGDVTGTISDATGAFIPNATVTATNESTDIKTVVTSNGEGTYHFTNLPVGSYTITGASQGFTPSGLSHIAVDLNKTVTVNITVAVGSESVSLK